MTKLIVFVNFNSVRLLGKATGGFFLQGGAERLVVDLVKQMQAMGDVVEILLFDGTETPLKAEAESAGIPVHALGKGWRAMRNPLLVFKVIRFLQRNKFDIVHSHNTSCQMLVAAASCFLPLRMVTSEHNTDNRRRRWRGYRIVDRWMYGRYGRVVCVGEETCQTLTAWLNCPSLAEKIKVIPNGIDVAKFANAQPAKELSEQKGYKILMVSAFRPQKDHPTLIRALYLLPYNYLLFLAGGSETDEDRKYLECCQSLVKVSFPDLG